MSKPLRTPTLLSLVAPVYDEEELIEEFVRRATDAIADYEFELVLVNDGSSDKTPELLDRLAAEDARVRVVHLSRNFGHQAALTAGLEHAVGDVVAMIDADLQDPPELIPDMIAQWSQGADVVYAVRRQREGETKFKLATASWFYKLFDKLAQVDLEPNSGDFRLLDRRALDALLAMTERSRFLRGMTVWVGFNQTAVSYQRDARHAGETKYTLRKMLRFSLDAIASFSHLPLQLATYVGMLSAGVAFIAIPVVIGLRIADSYLPGFGSITIAILLLGGIQLIALGVIGEYVGRIYDEVKHRPLYIVSDERNAPDAPGSEPTLVSATRAGLPARTPERILKQSRGTRGFRRPARACATPAHPPCSGVTMSHSSPPRLLASIPCAALACALVAIALAAGAPVARAEACPGSGHAPYCPYVSVQSIGQRGESVLRFPEAIAVGPAGDVYVADQLSYVVQKFTAAGAFETQWGSFGGGHGQFGPIGGLATDAAGEVYVVDSSHNRIQKFDPNGNFLASWGGRGTGLGRFNFGSSQNFTQPPGGGIAVAGSHVYVADTGNHRIERFDLSGGEPLQWGTHGSLPGQLAYPRGLAANATEVLVADDDNHRIQKFSPDGAYEAETGSQGAAPGQFSFPYGVALDAAGNSYVADNINARVVKLSPQLAFLGAWGGYGSRPGQLAFPRALASDPAGDTYVTDTANDRVQVFDPAGAYLRTLGASARGPGQMTGPRGLAVDPSGRLLVSDTVGNRVELFAPGGGPFVEQWAGDGAAFTGFSAPTAIDVDPSGSVYVSDEGGARVVRMWGDGTFLGALANPAPPAGAPPAQASGTVATDSAGRRYALDAKNNRVQVLDAEGRVLAKWGLRGIAPGYLSQPSAIAVGCDGAVYVADTNNNRVQRFNLASPAPGGCLAPGAWPPPLNVAPVLRVELTRSRAVLARRALALTVSCERGCKVLATATLTPLGARRRAAGVPLIAAARALPAAHAGHVRLRVGPRSLRRLRRALGRHRAMRARVSIVAAGPTGLRTTVVRTYTVTR